MPMWQPSPIVGPDWYDSAWPYRGPVLVDNLSGGGSTRDLSFTLPTDWDAFWANVHQTDGRDIRWCSANGRTLLGFKLVGFNASTRVLALQADDAGLGTSDGLGLTWLYWGNSAASAPSYASFTASSPVTCTNLLRSPAPLDTILRVSAQTPAQAALRDVVVKGSLETVPVWVDITPWLMPRAGLWGGLTGGDGVQHLAFAVEQGGEDQAALYTEGATRYTETPDGRHLVRVLIKAGTTANDYTGILTVTMLSGFARQYRFLIKVLDLQE